MSFSEIAPHLANPLILVGFVLFLFFGIHRLLIKARIIPPISPDAGSAVILLLLKYGFYVSVLVLTLGFFYAAYTAHLQRVKVVDYHAAIDGLRAQYETRLQEKDDTNTLIRAQLDETVATLKSFALATPGDERLAAALESFLEDNDPSSLVNYLEERTQLLADQGVNSLKAAAESALKLGRVLFFDDSPRALAALRRATELDPNNGQAWMSYAALNLKSNDFSEAERAYKHISELKPPGAGEFTFDLRMFALSQAGVANVYAYEGKLEEAETALNTAIMLLDPKTDAHNLLEALRVRVDVLTSLGKWEYAESELDKLEQMIVGIDKADGSIRAVDWFDNLKRSVKTSRCALDANVEKYEAALISCTNAVEANAGEPARQASFSSAKYHRGLARMNAGDLEAAESDLRGAREFFDRENPRAKTLIYANLGVVLLNKGQAEEGCDLLAQALNFSRVFQQEDLTPSISTAAASCSKGDTPADTRALGITDAR